MRTTWIRGGCGTALVAAALLLSGCNMGGRPEDATQQAALAPAEPQPTAVAPAALPGSIEYHAVTGDTVQGLAERFGISEQTLIEANALQAPFELTPGQLLTVPPRQEHVVVAGDTVYGIAKQYGIPRDELVRLNGIPPSNKIRIGQHLILPQPPVTVSAAAPQAAVTATDAAVAPMAPVIQSGPPMPLQPTDATPAAPSHQGVTAVELPPPPKAPAPAVEAAAAQPTAAPPVKPQPTAAAPVAAAAATVQPEQPKPAEPAAVTTTAVTPKPTASTPEAPAVPVVPAPAPAAAVAEPAPAETATAEVEPEPTPATPPAESGVETLTAAVADPPPLTSDKFMWPVSAGKVVLGFGPGTGGQQNDGVNIATPEGTAVRAAENGIVAYAGNELRGFGNLLLIRHADGWMTAYAHNETLLVKRGDTVKRGQIIARVGKTGNVTEPQLHFELRRGTRALDPVPYLGEGGSGVTPAASPGAQQDPG